MCDQMWDTNDATVACRQLGLDPTGNVFYQLYCILFMDITLQVPWLFLEIVLERVQEASGSLVFGAWGQRDHSLTVQSLPMKPILALMLKMLGSGVSQVRSFGL